VLLHETSNLFEFTTEVSFTDNCRMAQTTTH